MLVTLTCIIHHFCVMPRTRLHVQAHQSSHKSHVRQFFAKSNGTWLPRGMLLGLFKKVGKYTGPRPALFRQSSPCMAQTRGSSFRWRCDRGLWCILDTSELHSSIHIQIEKRFTVYAIYFAHRYFHDFGLKWGNSARVLISRFSDVFITINRHPWLLPRGNVSRGLTSLKFAKIKPRRENYHVYSNNSVYFLLINS